MNFIVFRYMSNGPAIVGFNIYKDHGLSCFRPVHVIILLVDMQSSVLVYAYKKYVRKMRYAFIFNIEAKKLQHIPYMV